MINIGKSTIYLDEDASLDWIASKKTGIIGFGNQGEAQALNLRDSDINIMIGLRENSKSIKKVCELGIPWDTIEKVSAWAEVLVILIPDEVISQVYTRCIEPFIQTSTVIIFAHGYSIHYQMIKPDSSQEVLLVSPSGPGRLLRQRFTEGSGIPTLVASNFNNPDSLHKALSYSKSIGGTRICAVHSSFQEETESDLFGEQAVLTGGIPHLILAAYNTLVKNGFQPVVAWLVCFYEVKLIVDLFSQTGLDGLNRVISNTAEYGGATRGKRIIGEAARQEMNTALSEITDQRFYKEYQSKKNFDHRKKDGSSECDSFDEISKFMLHLIHESGA